MCAIVNSSNVVSVHSGVSFTISYGLSYGHIRELDFIIGVLRPRLEL
jgi:hypothetical protein